MIGMRCASSNRPPKVSPKMLRVYSAASSSYGRNGRMKNLEPNVQSREAGSKRHLVTSWATNEVGREKP